MVSGAAKIMLNVKGIVAMFKKILITNRGDVALRVLRACKELDIPSVVVHSTADADSMPVRLADESVCIGPPSSAESYLNIPAILSAVAITGADAVHPGVGFLSENADFVEIVAAHGLTFIGPEPRHIRAMGDKVEAKITAAAAGLSASGGGGGGRPVGGASEGVRHRARSAAGAVRRPAP